jgi:hypothetical protein
VTHRSSSVSASSEPLGMTSADPPDPALSFAEGEASYGRARGAIEALATDAVGVVRAYILAAIAIVFGALPNIEARLDEMRKATPGLDFDELGRLRDYTLALFYLHLMTTPGEGAATDLPALLAEAGPLRTRMLSVAENLVLFGYVSAERVAIIRRGSGQLDQAEDLGALVRLFREAGPEVLAKTPISEEMLERAGELSFQIVAALGRRRVGSDGAGEPSQLEDHKARVFRLVVRTYDQARRGLSFLRWSEGDVDVLAPSIFAGRRRNRGAPAGEAPGGEGGPADPDATGTQ